MGDPRRCGSVTLQAIYVERHDVGRTNARGIAELDLDATFTGLGVMIGGPYSAGDPEGDKNTRELTDAELRELFSKHKLTIRW